MKTISDGERVLEFCMELSRRMILSGASLERVQLAVERICGAYHLSDVSLILLNNCISISVMDQDGHYASRQCAIPPAGIQLERLKALNRMSCTVVEETPPPEQLKQLLIDASQVRERPD